jgi:cytochrome P450 family 9
MRLMFSLMNEVGARMSNTLKDKINSGTSNKFEFKEFSRKFAIDVIATTAFGIEINSFEDPNNDFMRHTSKATDFNSFSSVLKLAGFFISGKLMKLLNVRFFNQDTMNFFQTAIIGTMNERQEKGIVRHDFVDLLMEVKKGTLSHEEGHEEEEKDSFATVEEHDVGKTKAKRQWDDEYLVAQSFGFFFAGFETVN